MTPDARTERSQVDGVIAGAAHYGAAYWEYQRPIGRRGAELNRWKFARYVHASDAVVDFGCGGGYLLAALPATTRIGVEPNALARAEAERNGITVLTSAAELADACADVVISNHALEHTLDPLQELCELRRALKPEGTLVLVVPSQRRGSRYRGGEVNRHLYTWTPQLLGNLLAEAGFTVIDCRLARSAWRLSYVRLRRLLAFRVLTWLAAVMLDGRQVIAVAEVAPRGPAGRVSMRPDA